ncbi:hypothetical protein SAY86_029054 [Trapa natans]|uniref:DC1 domain-containing protein n=1 Tax=Trapa natans TaxID=22666 RepID=A0AAN7RGZ7_TRANT|nr:hypothetical protein SAY86_029054 [Trapa natans]
MYGTGKRFRCEMCNFNLHEYCATCPTTLSSFLHEGPGHQLKLVLRRPPLPGQDANRICNICNIRIEGFFYQCVSCEFDVHPGCNWLPQQVNHTIDQNHPLTLQELSSGQCFVCHGACSGWRYSFLADLFKSSED